MKNTKRLLSLLLAVAMVLSLMPTFVLAEVTATEATETVVEVTDWDDLKTKIADPANAGAVLKLTRDIGAPEPVYNNKDIVATIGQNIILDLNGYLLRFRMVGVFVPITVSAGAALTIRDTSGTDRGAVDALLADGVTVKHLIDNYGTVIVESGNIRHVNNDKVDTSICTGHLVMNRDGASTTVTGGNFVALGEGLCLQKTGTGTYSMAGGTYNKTPNSGYLASGYGVWNNADKTYSVKKITVVTSRDTLLPALKTSGIVRLGANISTDTRSGGWIPTVTSGADVILDLNGYTLNYGLVIASTERNVIRVMPGGKLTITDNSTGAPGTVQATVSGTWTSGKEDTTNPVLEKAHAIRNDGTLIIEKGNFTIVNSKGLTGVVTYDVVRAFANSSTTVTGGNFIVDSAVSSGNLLYGATDAVMNVTGGTYSKGFDSNYIPKYYDFVENEDGTVSVVHTGMITATTPAGFVSAMNNATDGDVVVLGEDITISNASNANLTKVAANVTLDLNGHTLAYTLAGAGRNPITVEEKATLTITDSSDDADGAIIGNFDSKLTTGRHLLTNYGNLIIEKGTFAVANPNNVEIATENVMGCVVITYDNGVTTINGGTFSNVTSNDLLQNTKSTGSDVTGTTVVSGGSFAKDINTNYIVEGMELKLVDGMYVVQDLPVAGTIVEVSDIVYLKKYLQLGCIVKLTADIEMTNADKVELKGITATLDLNSHTITGTVTAMDSIADIIDEKTGEVVGQTYKATHFITISGGTTLTVVNGTINVEISKDNYTANVFRVNSVDTLILDNVTINYTAADDVTVPGYYADIVNSNGTVAVENDTKLYNEIGGTLYGWGDATIAVNGGMMNELPRMAEGLTYTTPAGTALLDADGDGYYVVTKAYTVTWIVEGEITTETYAEDATPVYPMGTPVKAEDDKFTYEFIGWTPEITPVTADVTYTAQFKEVAKKVSSISTKSKTLELKDLVQVNYYFNITGDYTDEYLLENAGLLVWLEDNTSEEYVAGTESYRVEGLKLTNKGYQVKAKGVAAKKLGDKMIARGYIINAEGEYEYSDEIDYNALTYITNMLGNTGASSYYPLLVSLLNYGAGAQIYFDYKTDDLMNKNLTDAQKALTAYNANQVKTLKTDTSKFKIAYDIVEDKLSRTLELADNINIKMKYTLSSAVTTGAKKIEVLYWTEAQYDAASELNYANATVLETKIESGNVYVGTITGIAPKDMGSTYYVCLYIEDANGVGHYSNICTYSIHEYAAKQAVKDPTGASDKLQKLYSLCQMIINYSYQADLKY